MGLYYEKEEHFTTEDPSDIFTTKPASNARADPHARKCINQPLAVFDRC